MNALIVKVVTQLKNAPLGRSLVSCVKGLPLPCSVSHLPHGTKNHPAEERSKERNPHGNFRRTGDEGRCRGHTHKGNKIKACTKSCYSCGEEGHISQNCLNGDLVEFSIEEVEYDLQEIEARIGTEKSRKRSRLDTRKDLTHITYFRCKESGHYFSSCPKRKPRDLSEVICFRCNEAGHLAGDCPKEKETCDN